MYAVNVTMQRGEAHVMHIIFVAAGHHAQIFVAQDKQGRAQEFHDRRGANFFRSFLASHLNFLALHLISHCCARTFGMAPRKYIYRLTRLGANKIRCGATDFQECCQEWVR